MAKKAKKDARKPSAALMRPMRPSPALSEVIGSKPIPRTEVTRKLWAYIRKNNLQDQRNKRLIKADAHLRAVFGGKPIVSASEVAKLVGKHVRFSEESPVSDSDPGLEALARLYGKV